MTEANHRPSKMLKQDPLVQIPSIKALTMTTTGGRAQIGVQNRPPTTNAALSTTQRSSGRKTYAQTSSKGANGNTQAPYHVCPPENPPEEPIPPKPPNFDCPTSQSNLQSNLHTPPNTFRDTMPMSDLQRDGITPLNGPIIPEQQMRWEQLHIFHANNK